MNRLRAFLFITIGLLLNGCYTYPGANGEIDLEELLDDLAILTTSDPVPIDFDDPISVTELTITIENAGSYTATDMDEDADLALAPPFSFKGGAYPGTGGDCSDTLEAEDTCTIVLEFDRGVPGSYDDTVAIQYFNGFIEYTLELPVTGVEP